MDRLKTLKCTNTFWAEATVQDNVQQWAKKNYTDDQVMKELVLMSSFNKERSRPRSSSLSCFYMS